MPPRSRPVAHSSTPVEETPETGAASQGSQPEGNHFHYLLEFCHTHPGSHEKKDPNWRSEHVIEWRPNTKTPARDLPPSFAEFLDSRVRFGVKVGLENTHALLTQLGLTGKLPPTFLVGGTNGKGTVATTLGEALSFAGYRVGVYTSPHVERFLERIQVSGGDPDDTVLGAACDAVQAATKTLDETGMHPTYFEVATALALCVFRGHRAQVMVLEVGMGGRGDAVNAIEPVASIITNVGDDHAKELGNTVAQRAAEKAGIMRAGVPCFTAATGVALQALQHEAVQRGTNLITVCAADGNAAPAQAAEALVRSVLLDANLWQRLPRLRDLDATSIHAARMPGRHEAFELTDNRVALLDVAHNRQAFEALGARLDAASTSPAGRILLAGLLQDKDAQALADFALHRFEHVIVTRPATERAMEPDAVARTLDGMARQVEVIPDLDAALAAANSRLPTGGLLVVTGSFYVVGPVRAALRRRAIVV